jgi:hypothetical protein
VGERTTFSELAGPLLPIIAKRSFEVVGGPLSLVYSVLLVIGHQWGIRRKGLIIIIRITSPDFRSSWLL